MPKGTELSYCSLTCILLHSASKFLTTVCQHLAYAFVVKTYNEKRNNTALLVRRFFEIGYRVRVYNGELTYVNALYFTETRLLLFLCISVASVRQADFLT